MSIIYEALKKIEKKEEKKTSFKNFTPFFLLASLLAIFVLLFVFKFSNFIGTFRKKEIAKTNFLNSSQPNLKKNLSENIPNATPTKEPFSFKKYNLQGIIYDKDNPIAVINGKKTRAGDKIEDATVISIFQDGVVLENSDGKTYLTLD